jgi:lauroyl/myristoyl acyltransferase
VTDWGYVLAAAAARLPRPLSESLAIVLADIYTFTHPERARAIERRLHRTGSTSLDGRSHATARETHRAFARALRDFLASGPSERPRVRLDEEGRTILRNARASGTSTILLSGHFGPWEAALQGLSAEIGSVDALARAHRLPAVERFFEARRARFGVRTLSARQAIPSVLARLRSGGWIAALADRASDRLVPTRTRNQSEEWRPDGLVPLDRRPLLLARRTSSQVLAGVAWRDDDGTIEVRFHPPFTLEPRHGGIAMSQALDRLQRFFDAHVRAHPTQWFDWGAWAR